MIMTVDLFEGVNEMTGEIVTGYTTFLDDIMFAGSDGDKIYHIDESGFFSREVTIH